MSKTHSKKAKDCSAPAELETSSNSSWANKLSRSKQNCRSEMRRRSNWSYSWKKKKRSWFGRAFRWTSRILSSRIGWGRITLSQLHSTHDRFVMTSSRSSRNNTFRMKMSRKFSSTNQLHRRASSTLNKLRSSKSFKILKKWWIKLR